MESQPTRGTQQLSERTLKADLLDRVPTPEEKDYANSWEATEEQLGRERFVELFQHILMIYQREKPRERLEVGFEKFVTDFDNHAKFMNDVLLPYGETFTKLRSPIKFAGFYGNEATKHLRYLMRLTTTTGCLSP